jgi:hypothetical protein
MTPEEYELIGVTPESILTAMLFGFSFVVFCWFSGYVIGLAKSMISKV